MHKEGFQNETNYLQVYLNLFRCLTECSIELFYGVHAYLYFGVWVDE